MCYQFLSVHLLYVDEASRLIPFMLSTLSIFICLKYLYMSQVPSCLKYLYMSQVSLYVSSTFTQVSLYVSSTFTQVSLYVSSIFICLKYLLHHISCVTKACSVHLLYVDEGSRLIPFMLSASSIFICLKYLHIQNLPLLDVMISVHPSRPQEHLTSFNNVY